MLHLRWHNWETRFSLTKHSYIIFLHRVGSSWVTPDDPAKQCFSALSKSEWSGLGPDDPDLGLCERLEGPSRMIRLYTGWSRPGKSKCVFSLFCHYSGWSGNHQKTHNGHFREWEYIYPFTPFISSSLLPTTNQTSQAFISPLSSIQELDSSKNSPRDRERVRFEGWVWSPLWASTCSSEEALEATFDSSIRVCYSWSFAPRRLEVPVNSHSFVVEPPEVCITPFIVRAIVSDSILLCGWLRETWG